MDNDRIGGAPTFRLVGELLDTGFMRDRVVCGDHKWVAARDEPKNNVIDSGYHVGLHVDNVRTSSDDGAQKSQRRRS
jgi:hypothetical protein